MKPQNDGILIVAENRKARHEYEILKTYEAGLVLMGSEVKSIRDRQVQLKDAYVSFRGDEAFLQNAHIAVYKASSYNNHEPERLRKLLLNRQEIDQIITSIQEKGLTCVALKVYFKKGRAKVELALARGKKLHDKRESIKKRDASLELKRSLQKSRRG
ncbi:MAG: SsrA-binding protein SmpB [Bdellovibrionaceae bacterium]|nr:SsrA-binding protein SmpB [Pseudobdellovibrionaceae bacterium]